MATAGERRPAPSRDPSSSQDAPEWIREALVPPQPAPGEERRDPQTTRTGSARRTIALLVAAVLLVGGGFAVGQVVRSPLQSDSEASRSNSTGVALEEPVSAVAEALLPSVVQIETEGGLGSGVIYRKRGLILTAAHVVDEADRVTIRLADGRRISGKVVGTDADTDVGVVETARGNLPAAPLALGEPLRVGQLAVAIGSPFGLEGSVTSGVVSAIDRVISLSGRGSASMIQTDAPINPGNSGGALADRHGKVIGINDAIRTSSGVSSGVGFAIPIDIAASVADALVVGKSPKVGFLGVVGTEPGNGPPGALVVQVRPGSPAADAGLRRGDLITAIGARRVEGMGELASAIRLTPPGTEVTLDVIRGGRKLELEVRVGAQ